MDSLISRQHQSDGAAALYDTGKQWVLVQKAIDGDANALEFLVAPHLGRLYHVALTMLRNREDAEDALQEGLYKANRCLRSFHGRSSFSTWLTRIVINTALMTLRRRRSHPETSLDEILENRPEWLAHGVDHRLNPEQACSLAELMELIEEQIVNLPASERAAFLHYAVNDHSIAESCQALGIPETTFKSRIFRTRRKLAHGVQFLLERPHGTSAKRTTHHVA